MKLSDKIITGILLKDSFEYKKESEEIQHLINCFSIGFVRWCMFMNEQTDDFDKFTDDELLEMYEQDCKERIKNRLRK